MMTLALIVGLWSTTCIQTQISGGGQGFAVETYEISKTGEFEFSREWFLDDKCIEAKGLDMEAGKITLGPKLTGMFATGDSYEANFVTESGTDLGSVAIKEGHSLKFGRGMKGSNMRNTMVGVFEYLKQ